MDFLLLTFAILLIILAGSGIGGLLRGNQPSANLIELFALSFLLGASLVSASLFLLGFFISGSGLRWSVTAICLAVGLSGWKRNGFSLVLSELWPQSRATKLLLLVTSIQIAFVGWLCSVRVLGWDGLLNFEVKARLIFLNGGKIPLEFFSDSSRDWTHQNYPLMLPLIESWLYLWLNHADQGLVKVVAWMFFISAICLLYAANRRLGVASWQMLTAPLMIFTVPLLLIGDGSASSGYADFPMAVFYLAAIIYVIEFWQSENFTALRLAGLIAAAGCWLKQDGIILWFCVTILVCLKALFELKRWGTDWRKWLQLAITISLGLLVFGGWQLFVNFVGAPARTEVQPFELETLQTNAWLLPVIVKGVILELLNLRHWGVLWLTMFVSIVWLLLRHNRLEFIALSLAVVLPILAYASLHFFFHGSPLTRLLIQVSLVAVTIVGVAVSQLKKSALNNYT